MARPKTLEFANFTLTFGKDKVLADFFEEIVYPAFSDTGLRRHHGISKYFFTKVERLDVGTKSKPEPAVVGVFVKDTVLRSTQNWNATAGQIEAKKNEIPDAPSATFVLILATHKLLYLHETPRAPTTDTLAYTLQRFLNRKWLDFIDREYKRRREPSVEEVRTATSKKDLKQLFPPPTLSIIPLSSEDGVAASLKRFETLKSVSFTLTKVNAEADDNPLFDLVRKEQENVGADVSTLIEARSDKKESLDKEAVGKQLAAVALQGNALVKLSGLSAAGVVLNVRNDEMRLRLPMVSVPDPMPEKAKILYQEYLTSELNGTILVGKVDEAKAAELRERFSSK